ncbi:hypothetical protein MMUR_65860 [Mycolicibacterium murale]|uniref:Uncharacterized protein n=1 Tax=Mycolicibacterium murale TaxID=182220 RepID=A0A7I9WYJ4_9MYCO|nr:hypothetical protein MMUR_65860 [Mycolicibacterium murale]
MARGGQHRDPQAGGVDDLAVAQGPPEPAQEAAAHRAHHRSGALHQLVDAVGVITVAVTDQHQSDAAQRRDPLDVRVVVGSGIDDHPLVAAPTLEHPRVGALEGHDTGLSHNSTEAESVTGRSCA